MSDSYFLDSNIIVYLFDPSQAKKQKIAKELFEQAHGSKDGLISIQVIQEFTNVVTRKFATPLTFLDLQSFILTGLRPLCRVHTDVNLLIRALRIRDSSGYSFYDALIVAAALQAGCTRLYSEDLQNGQMIETLKVVNPFA
jgi:predicted nucleic acid-binding protein